MHPLLYLIFVVNLIACSITSYLILFSDVDDKGINGQISRFFMVTCSDAIKRACYATVGRGFFEKIYNVYDYIVNKPNPLLLILYLIIINTIYMIWLTNGHPYIPPSLEDVYLNYHYCPFIGVLACQISFYYACAVPPGEITKDNVDCYMHSEYDGTLYIENKECRTCKTYKVLY